MPKLRPATLVAAAASLLSGSLMVAPQAGASLLPLASVLRACDGTKLPSASATGYARATANVANDSSGSIVTTVDIATAVPGTRYDVRVIQIPRGSIGCGPGAPGVIVGSLQTDDVGGGSTTFQGPIRAGATGAWVIVERPGEYTQTPAEFYTSDYAAPL